MKMHAVAMLTFLSFNVFAYDHQYYSSTDTYRNPMNLQQPLSTIITYTPYRTEVKPPLTPQAYLGPTWVNSEEGKPLSQYAVRSKGSMDQAGVICRVHYRDGIYPGSLTSEGRCNFSYQGSEVSAAHYQMLISHTPLFWVESNYGNLPDHALVGGHENGKPSYLCQAKSGLHFYVGKMINQRCYVAFNNQTQPLSHYFVLTL